MARATKQLYEDLANFISEYTQENLDQKLLIEDLASRVGVSRFHLNRLFQATTGFQLGEFIQRRRLQSAHALLAKGESVTAASLAVGYDSHAAFSRAFLKAFGCTPGAVKAGIEVSWKTPNTLKNSCRRDDRLQPEFVDLPERIYHGHYGAGFNDNSFVGLANELVSRLSCSLGKFGVTAFPSPPIGVSLESPWLSGQSESRFFMGIALEPPSKSGDMQPYLWAGGRWAKFRHQGPYELMWQTISRIYAGWVIPEAVVLRDDNLVQLYRNNPRDTPAQQMLTEIYFPVLR